VKIDLFFYFLSLYPVKKSKELRNESFVEVVYHGLLGFLCEFQSENDLFRKFGFSCQWTTRFHRI